MGRVTFVIGGARSGKSAFALSSASRVSGSKVYIATAQAYDREMEERIAKHRKERGSGWETHEEPVRLGEAVRTALPFHDAMIIDCLTLWLSNLMCADADIGEAVDDFIAALSPREGDARVFIVSNEVGMGIVPDNELARRFRDAAGRLNQRVAEVADEVFLVTAGIPVKIK